jgi:hypothetical protein
MAFKLAIADTVGINVNGSTRDANGVEQPFAFALFCDRLKNDDLVAWVTEPGRTANRFFQEHAKGWRDQALVLDDANQPAPFSAEALEAARLWAGGQFTTEEDAPAAQGKAELDEDAAVFGIRIVGPVAPPRDELHIFHLWPENMLAWEVFLACGSQWRVSMDGREGLDYPGVEIVLQAFHLRPRRRQEVRRHLRVMEFACLDEWASQRRNKRDLH